MGETIRKSTGFLCFFVLFLIGCNNQSRTTEFCARFYANSTTVEEDEEFMRNKKLSNRLPNTRYDIIVKYCDYINQGARGND